MRSSFAVLIAVLAITRATSAEPIPNKRPESSYTTTIPSCGKLDTYRCDSKAKFSKCDHSGWVNFDCPAGTECDTAYWQKTGESPCVHAKSSYTPPAKVESYTPPKETYTPPKETYTPPKETYAHKAETYTKPKETYKADTYTPPKETYEVKTYSAPTYYGGEDKSYDYSNDNESYGKNDGYSPYNGGYSDYSSYNDGGYGKAYLQRRDYSYNTGYDNGQYDHGKYGGGSSGYDNRQYDHSKYGANNGYDNGQYDHGKYGGGSSSWSSGYSSTPYGGYSDTYSNGGYSGDHHYGRRDHNGY